MAVFLMSRAQGWPEQVRTAWGAGIYFARYVRLSCLPVAGGYPRQLTNLKMESGSPPCSVGHSGMFGALSCTVAVLTTYLAVDFGLGAGHFYMWAVPALLLGLLGGG